MFKKKDPNSFTKYFKLFNGTASSDDSNLIGYLIADYQVVPYDDVEVKDNTSFMQNKKEQFLLHCKQRIVIFNPNFSTIPLISIANSPYYPYENYPALINTFINVAQSGTPQAGVSFQLLDYSPKTINTKIQSSGSSGVGTGSSQSSSISNTIGSSTSQTNSYSTSVGVDAGVMGDVFSFGENVSQTSEHSTTSSQDHSHTTGSDSSSSQSRNQSNSDSMSMKDWGAYSMVNPFTKNPIWFFGQEYPWDAIISRLTDDTPNPNTANLNCKNQLRLILPFDMQHRLFDGSILYPPSQLSMFGFSFVNKAVWLIVVDYSKTGASSNMQITHNINYYSASHSLTNNSANVYLDKTPTILQCEENQGNITTNLNLMIMAMDVLSSQNKPAIIGFIPNKFIINPSQGPFKILSTSNTLMIEDTTDYGDTVAYPAAPYFTASDRALMATLTTAPPKPLSITAYFKVVDTVNDYKLYLKHWKTGATGIKLTININGDIDNSIIKYVDALEAEGGENNLLTISLRDQNFSSIDYHDYLQLGLNSIQLTIEPIDGQYGVNFGYQLRAISIEK